MNYLCGRLGNNDLFIRQACITRTYNCSELWGFARCPGSSVCVWEEGGESFLVIPRIHMNVGRILKTED